MAGGGGNHFWPLSREDRPKQFIGLGVSGRTFLQHAYSRCHGLVPEENILVVTLDRYAALVREQLPELPEANLLLEPYGRKTGPCIVYSTYDVLRRDPDAIVAMCPSDLIIEGEDSFRQTVSDAMDYVRANPVLMTIGIVPSRPDPNYGYIQIRGGRKAIAEGKPMEVKTFTEKPDEELAKVFCKSGEFFWNSGIFVWQAAVIRQEMEHYMPRITELFDGWQGALGSPSEKAFLEKAYAGCENVSIDYGVMEKTSRSWLFPARFGWSDLDGWDSLHTQYRGKDASGNATNSSHTIFEQCSGNTVLSKDKHKLLAVRGLKDFVVIDTPDVLMICPKDDADARAFVAGTALPGFEDYR